jgi:hypothetical protein
MPSWGVCTQIITIQMCPDVRWLGDREWIAYFLVFIEPSRYDPTWRGKGSGQQLLVHLPFFLWRC